MEIKKINVNDIDLIRKFLAGMNLCFSQRKDRNNLCMSFKEVSESDFLNEISENCQVWICEEKNQLLGGLCCSYCIEDNIKMGKIYHVWVDSLFRKKGIATNLLCTVEKEAEKKGCKILRLNVANTYMPAIKLYRKEGYLPLKIYANEPYTYFFIRYIKAINGYEYSSIKRRSILFFSIVKFFLLYRRDSSPTGLNRLIYGSKL